MEKKKFIYLRNKSLIMNPKTEYLIDLIFKKLKNYKGKESTLEKDNLRKFIFLLLEEN